MAPSIPNTAAAPQMALPQAVSSAMLRSIFRSLPIRIPKPMVPHTMMASITMAEKPTAITSWKVRTVPGGMNLSSTIANKGADIQVNFNDNNEKGSEIIVFSANGAKVKSFKVPAGQKTATFNVNGSAGMYLVNRAQNGKANETKKIVIK